MIEIVLAEDHGVVRQGLKALLAAEEDFAVVGETDDGIRAAELIEDLTPDVAVVDLMMPGLNGLDVTSRVARSCPETRVVILSMYAEEAYVLQALRNGAHGYVIKDASAAQLVTAIREAVGGRRYLSPPLTEAAIDAYASRVSASGMDSYETLSPRERQILHLVAEGLTSPQISERLEISSRTVDAHRASIMKKLGLRSRTEIVKYALARGLLPLEGGGLPQS